QKAWSAARAPSPRATVVPTWSPAAEVDGPLVDDLVAVEDQEALVVGDGRVDVGGHQAEPFADLGQLAVRRVRRRGEGRVLVRAEPHVPPGQHGVAVVH